MKDRYALIIIGGGAAGLAAAIAAAKTGIKPLVLEAGDSAGKKILSTGNGKCNYGNLQLNGSCYHSGQPAFVEKVLTAFNTYDTVAFFRELGILPRIRNGYLYPRSEQAKDLRNALLHAVAEYGIDLRTDSRVISVRHSDAGFTVDTGTELYVCERLILAAGGKAAPRTGSDGSGYLMASDLGHSLRTVTPALTGLTVKPSIRIASGVRTEAVVSLYIDGTWVRREEGELQFSDHGLSGIPILQLSGEAARAISEKRKVELELDFFPEYGKRTLSKILRSRGNEPDLTGLLPDKLCRLCRETAGSKGDLASVATSFRLNVTDTNGFDRAQTCSGGVDVRQIHPDTMESRKLPGLYFAGEIMDVDGQCGGYNLHWAWATGILAGTAASGKTFRHFDFSEEEKNVLKGLELGNRRK